ncbi:MAG: DUF177 domain-containing protein [bacterium]
MEFLLMALIIDIAKIPPGGMHLSGAISPAELDVECEGVAAKGDLAYDLDVEVVSSEFLARGRLHIPLEFTCSRCLKPFAARINVDRFTYSQRVKGIETIDLTGNLREDIIIALPIKPLCARTCKGLCAHCGKDLNLERCSCALRRDDARWSALEGLKFPPEKKE